MSSVEAAWTLARERRADGDLIAVLQQTTAAVLHPLIPKSGDVALLDFPSCTNVGDSAIWLGQLRWLRLLGLGRPRYTCEQRSYDREQLARRIGQGTILFSGGGNFGDLYPHHQRFREAVIEAFPHNPIVQLPQTLCFRDARELARTRAVFNRHPNLTLLVRDRRSLELAANNFLARVALCPDMAFGLGSLERPGPPRHPALWLMRRDDEAAVPDRLLPSGVFADWSTQEPAKAAARLHAGLRQLAWRPRARRVVGSLMSATYSSLARARLAAGCALLAEAETIVTDRLHGHILALLLGIPHVVLNDRFGKVRSFLETWTMDCALTRWAESAGEARWLAAAAAHHG